MFFNCQLNEIKIICLSKCIKIINGITIGFLLFWQLLSLYGIQVKWYQCHVSQIIIFQWNIIIQCRNPIAATILGCQQIAVSIIALLLHYPMIFNLSKKRFNGSGTISLSFVFMKISQQWYFYHFTNKLHLMTLKQAHCRFYKYQYRFFKPKGNVQLKIN